MSTCTPTHLTPSPEHPMRPRHIPGEEGIWVFLFDDMMVFAILVPPAARPGGADLHVLLRTSPLLIAFVKIRFVGLYFMELRAAPIVLRGIFEAYCAVVGLTLAVLYLLT